MKLNIQNVQTTVTIRLSETMSTFPASSSTNPAGGLGSLYLGEEEPHSESLSSSSKSSRPKPLEPPRCLPPLPPPAGTFFFFFFLFVLTGGPPCFLAARQRASRRVILVEVGLEIIEVDEKCGLKWEFRIMERFQGGVAV